MSFAHKIRVAVLRGGPSSEYEVSLKSGEAVLKNLPTKYEGVDVFISKDGVWHVHGMEKSPVDALRGIDVAFVALHGQYGEDGKIQRILEHMGIPFTGSGSFSSAVAMNKHLTKGALARLKDKVRFAAHKLFSRDEIRDKGAHVIFREITIPAVVKPASAGSSVGVSIVKGFFDLESALAKALDHSDSVIIEEFIQGREATCGVLEGFRGESHYALLPVEILPAQGSSFFDYDAKYGGGSVEICPGNFDEATKRAIQGAAQAVHRELGLRHYSRSDFIVHPKRGVYFLETNTLPGLTSESLLPKSVKAVGSDLSQFLDHLITLARE
ncbi:MAG TPA: D-alanine--D-alanine ligase [Candidatus Paceibacterota bacterium]|jgi:D-alanine-D-alanine ligase|nr:D-alanine--D-alanine ligase [Candidatus Paceibacterota bacterium]